jgi:methylated-DNA-protein-cysteine methyltransferase-like protein
MSKDPGFFEKVYHVVKLVPTGRVTTYGAIARAIGSPGAGRMVGWALNKSFADQGFVPAHRVVNRNGMLTGKLHFGGRETMRELLASEGVCIEGDQVLDFDHLFWDPIKNCDEFYV